MARFPRMSVIVVLQKGMGLMNRTRYSILLVLLLALIVQVYPMTAQSERLVVYSGRSEGLIQPLLQQFTRDTGIEVEVRYGNTAEMAATILEEGSNSPADVFIAQDAGALGALAAAGRLRPLPSDILERVPTQFESASGEWVGLSGRARVLVYNTNLVNADQLPGSLLDLTGNDWQAKVGWSPQNGSFQAQVTAMRILLGEDAARQWLEGMIANGAASYPNNDSIVQAVIDGEIAAGLVNHYYVFRFKTQFPDAPINLHYFAAGDVGALINVAGAGVLNTSRHPGLAQRLILYLLGREAQAYFAQETNEYPLVAGVELRPDIPALDSIEAPALDLSQLADLQATLDLLRDTGALP